MPILSSDINSKVRYYSGTPLDKIVRVFTGSYSSGNLIARSGTFGPIYVHRIPHGLGRPVFCDLLWSTDNATFYDNGTYNIGGSVQGHIAFSDSTYVYIFHDYVTTGTPIYYKVYCSWIDDYDASNPSVTVQNYGDTNTQYDSRLNYQKIYTVEEKSIPAGTGASAYTTSVFHDIGTTPNAKGYFQPFAGEVWPVNGGGASNLFLYDAAQDEAVLSIDSNSVDLRVNRFSNAARRAWIKVYYDGN